MLIHADPPAATHPAAADPPGGSRTVRRHGRLPAAFRARVRPLGGLAILAVLGWRLGAGGFLDGLRAVDAGTLLAASGIGLLTTVLSAWRWCLVARGLGSPLPLSGAVADYYRSLFLNSALPGGVLGDVHRALRHGRDVGDLGLGVRAVVLERSAGQLVLVAVGVAVLLALPTPALVPGRLATPPPAAAVALAAGGLAVAVVLGVAVAVRLRRTRPRRGGALRTAGSALRTAGSAVRRGLLARRVWPGVVFASTAALGGYLATFLVAAHAAGTAAPVARLVPLAVLALLAMTVPVNVGGWGPREGACAWAFGAAGLGADQGVTVAVVYGLSVAVASLPGAGVLAVRWFTRRRSAGRRSARRPAPGQPAANRSDSA